MVTSGRAIWASWGKAKEEKKINDIRTVIFLMII